MLLAILAAAALGQGPCPVVPLLPAYSHNDYLNARPLADAMALGYRGVEVDLYRAGSQLLVGHDRSDLRPSRTLKSLYLRPLELRLARCGFLVSPSEEFLLNIEIKEEDARAFDILVEELSHHEALWRAGRIRVVLVGWWPASPETGRIWPSYLTVQRPIECDGREPPASSTPIGLISVDYSKCIKWDGRGTAALRAQQVLARAKGLGRVHGAPVRVHQVPTEPRIYDWLGNAGVDLIGVKGLEVAAQLLRSR